MLKIELSEVDHNLFAEVQAEPEGWEAFEAKYPDATVGNQCYHIIFNGDIGRGAIVFVGSGSSGCVTWADAWTPDELYERFLAGAL